MATSVLHLSKCKKGCLCLRLGTHKMNENRLNLVKEITRHFLANSELKDTEERIQTWKCWQLNNVKGNVTVYKNVHMTITHSPCCPIFNVAEIMLLYVINVTILNIHN